jgi:hypothetical protein
MIGLAQTGCNTDAHGSTLGAGIVGFKAKTACAPSGNAAAKISP